MQKSLLYHMATHGALPARLLLLLLAAGAALAVGLNRESNLHTGDSSGLHGMLQARAGLVCLLSMRPFHSKRHVVWVTPVQT